MVGGASSECAEIVAGAIVEANKFEKLKGKLKASAPGTTSKNIEHLMMAGGNKLVASVWKFGPNTAGLGWARPEDSKSPGRAVKPSGL